MKSCKAMQRRISAYHENELSADEIPALQTHLARCAECRATLVEMEQLSGFLRLSFSSCADPQEAVADRVMELLRHEPYRPLSRKFSTRWKLPAMLPASLAAAGLVGLAVAASFQPWNAKNILPDAHPVQVASVQPPSPPPVSSRKSIPIVNPRNAGPGRTGKRNPAAVDSPSLLRPVHRVPAQQNSPEKISAVPPANASRPRHGNRTHSHSSAIHSPSRSEGLETVPLQSLAALPHPTSPVLRNPGDSALPKVLAASGGRTARLQQVAGIVQARSDESEWSSLPPNSPVPVDQRVRSGEDSRFVLALEGGPELRMNAETEVVPMRAPSVDAPYWVIRLVRGEVFARVPKGSCGLKVLTPAGDAVSRDGEFIVQANELYETRLLVARGMATLENENGRSKGTEGMQVCSRLGAAPDAALPTMDTQVAFRWAYAPLIPENLPRRPG